MVMQIHVDGPCFRDSKNREVTIRGINLAADSKLPSTPDTPSYEPAHFFDGDNVSFTARPFPLDEAAKHFQTLRVWGYNTLRYIFTWEAIEHAGPGKYDEEFVQHTISVLRVAKRFGFWVYMDPHQDVWSRFSGGSGAPMWTLYACGLNPEAFAATDAAVVQNTAEDPDSFPKMIWATNYERLVCQVIFTLFFGGRHFAPKAMIDGVNIQDYLQDHFVGACKHLAQRIREAGDLEDCVFGWESMNEPHKGMIGRPLLDAIPPEQKLRNGTSPTAWQAILTGSGRAVEVEVWAFGGMGPYKAGSKLIDPQGTSAWLPVSHDDTKYGWRRSESWKLGECLWAQHGIWDPVTNMLLKNDYFSKDPKTGTTIDYPYFTNTYFMTLYRKYRDAIRSVFPSATMLCQSAVLELPPDIKGSKDDDPNMVFAPHWYEGVTLMTKHWNRLWNVDVFGIMRGRYSSPAFAIKVGETAIRNMIRASLEGIKQEGLDRIGAHPCVFTEIGIPFDMDDGYAYKSLDYSSQVAALDANLAAVEGAGVGSGVWCYAAGNTHRRGDRWNAEDLSVISLDDSLPPPLGSDADGMQSNTGSTSNLISASAPDLSLRRTTTGTSTILARTTSSLWSTSATKSTSFRAAEASMRPYASAAHGSVSSTSFTLTTATFLLKLTATSATPEDGPTEIFLPRFHFPHGPDGEVKFSVEKSGGQWSLVPGDVESGTIRQLLWWHSEGEQWIKIVGKIRKANAGGMGEEDGEEEDEDGWCGRERTCSAM